MVPLRFQLPACLSRTGDFDKTILVIYGCRLSCYVFSSLFIVITVTKFNSYIRIFPARYFFEFQGLNFDISLFHSIPNCFLLHFLRNRHYLYNIVISIFKIFSPSTAYLDRVFFFKVLFIILICGY